MKKGQLLQIRVTADEKQVLRDLVAAGIYYTISDAVADGIRLTAIRRRMNIIPRSRPRPPKETRKTTLFPAGKAVK